MNKYLILYKFKIIEELINLTFDSNSKSTKSNHQSLYYKHLVQKIIELGISEFLTDSNFNTLMTKNKVKTKNFMISRDGGFESISNVLVIKSVIKFILLWTSLFLYYFILFIFVKNNKPREKIIIFGAEHLDFNKNDVKKNFINFIKKHITTKSNYDVVISSSSYKTLIFENFFFRRYPHSFIFNSGLKFKEFIKIQSIHSRYLFTYFSNVINDRRSAILAKDFAIISIFDYANQKKLIKSIVFTNTNMNYQPLWSSNYINKNFLSSMFWYSENSCPVVSDVNNNKKYFNKHHPHLKLLNIDNHFVWTKFFAKTLYQFTSIKNCKVIGPILWNDIKDNSNFNPTNNGNNI
jgi:hypothetical protein